MEYMCYNAYILLGNEENMKIVYITTEYIKLGQMLKLEGIIENGALAKDFLSENQVLVNGIFENRRGKKLYNNDVVTVFDVNYTISSDKTNA